MNKTEWQKMGFKVFFRNSRVFLYQPNKSNAAYWLYNDNGKWMEHDNLDLWNRINIGGALLADFTASTALCYCNNLGNDSTCDFCGTTRNALQYLGLPRDASEAEINVRLRAEGIVK